jgi:ribosomal protein S18 acetylase RimI-like enzyme
VITVRVARPEEYERVGALTHGAYAAIPVDHLWGGYDTEILDTATRAEHGDILVAVTNHDSVIGAVMYVGDPASAWLEWTEPGESQFRLLAVDPSARQLGAGSALVQACLERAAASGHSVLIHTTPWMVAAHRIYERFGFVRRPDRDVPYEKWNEGRDLDLPDEWIGKPFLAYSWSREAH